MRTFRIASNSTKILKGISQSVHLSIRPGPCIVSDFFKVKVKNSIIRRTSQIGPKSGFRTQMGPHVTHINPRAGPRMKWSE